MKDTIIALLIAIALVIVRLIDCANKEHQLDELMNEDKRKNNEEGLTMEDLENRIVSIENKLTKVTTLFLDYLLEHEYAGMHEPDYVKSIQEQLENILFKQ